MARPVDAPHKPTAAPAETLGANLCLSVGIAVCGVIIVAFPYYAGYGPEWSGRCFFFGYAVIFLGFILSALLSAAVYVGGGFLLASGAVLFLIVGLDFWSASLGRDSTAGSLVELLILLLMCFAVILAAVGLPRLSDTQGAIRSHAPSDTETGTDSIPTETVKPAARERGGLGIIAVLALLTALVQFAVALAGL